MALGVWWVSVKILPNNQDCSHVCVHNAITLNLRTQKLEHEKQKWHQNGKQIYFKTDTLYREAKCMAQKEKLHANFRHPFCSPNLL